MARFIGVLLALGAACLIVSSSASAAQLVADTYNEYLGSQRISFVEPGYGSAPEPNDLTISEVNGQIQFHDAATPLDPGPCDAVDSHTARCVQASEMNIAVIEGADDDVYRNELPPPASSAHAYPTVQVIDGPGDDVIQGGNSNEDITVEAVGNDWISGGAGRDTLNFLDDAGRSGLDITIDGVANDRLGPGADHGNLGSGIDSIWLTSGNDRFVGSDERDEVLDFGGQDYVDGRGGNDWIVDRYGSNTIFGGAGDDFIGVADDPSQRGSDTVECGAGFDAFDADKDDVIAADCQDQPARVVYRPVMTFPAQAKRSGRKALKLKLRCSAAAWPCSGSVNLRPVDRSSRKGGRSKLGHASFVTRSRKAFTVRVKLNRAGRAALRPGARVVSVVRARDGRGVRSETARVVSVR